MPAPPQGASFNPSRRRFLLGAAVATLALGGGHGELANAAMDVEQMRSLMLERHGHDGVLVIEAWLGLLRDLQDRSTTERLNGVNDFFNHRIRWIEDIQIWGKEDFWATPLETLIKGAGDCEDYAIAKYQTLKTLGIPGRRLRMIYVRARIGRSDIIQAHMVLGYYESPTDEPLVLDNLLPDILPASQRSDLTPVFSFNSDGLWTGGAQDSLADPTRRLSRWRNVLQRMTAEGVL
ncbi:transglutaminase-like cysteine peptidase [Halomonas sp. M20]|uniref:transglutaminase-like cysteine peptidase n=1 Tax=Halomonas sp. M20 TaxID=2763264 RepID=UPI001D09AF30|nr:transglutaminase-like cysteine peptidase [Halomonas sp. M20]